jgi:hypothetical protein
MAIDRRPMVSKSSWTLANKRLCWQFANCESGVHSLSAVASSLNESGDRTRRGTQWRLESVVRAINQEAANGQLQVA